MALRDVTTTDRWDADAAPPGGSHGRAHRLPARRICGGPDDSHYEIDAATERLTLTGATTVVLITTTPSGLGHETVAPSALPQRLDDHRFGRIFQVTRPSTAVTALDEQYHP